MILLLLVRLLTTLVAGTLRYPSMAKALLLHTIVLLPLYTCSRQLTAYHWHQCSGGYHNSVPALFYEPAVKSILTAMGDGSVDWDGTARLTSNTPSPLILMAHQKWKFDRQARRMPRGAQNLATCTEEVDNCVTICY